jgi:hypothetical protein
LRSCILYVSWEAVSTAAETVVGGVPRQRAFSAPRSPMIPCLTCAYPSTLFISFSQEDDPADCVRAFCKEHGLGDEVVAPLLEHVQGELERADALAAAVSPGGVGGGVSPDVATKEKKVKKVKKVKKSNEVPIHERLYRGAENVRERQVARMREQEEARREVIRQARVGADGASETNARKKATPGGPDPLVDRLYRQGVQARALKTLEYEQERQRREEAELAQYSFKPAIGRTPAAMQAQMGQATKDDSSVPGWQRLWENAEHQRKQTEEKRLAKLAEEQQKETAECKFQPAIDPTSRRIAGERVEALRENNITVFDQLAQDAERRRMRSEQFQAFRPAEATFAPVIDEKSRVMALKSMKTTSTMSAFNAAAEADGVVQAALRREGNDGGGLESLPLDDDQETGEVGGNDLLDEDDFNVDVVDRLAHRETMRRQRIAAAQRTKEALATVDPSTGKPLFQPEIGRANRDRQTAKAGLSIGDHLYQRALDKIREKELAAAAKQSTKNKFMSRTSKEYLARLRLRRFEQIFEYMVEASGGSDPTTVDVAALLNFGGDGQATNNLSLFHPVLDSMDVEVRSDVVSACELAVRGKNRGGSAKKGGSGPVRIKVEQFVECMADVLDAAPGPRTYLLPVSRVRSVDENLTFQPQVCAKSMSLARSQLRPEGGSVYHALYEEARGKARRVDDLKKRVEADRQRECTFKPVTNQFRGVSSNLSMLRGSVDGSSMMLLSRPVNAGEGEELVMDASGNMIDSLQAQLQSLQAAEEGEKSEVKQAWDNNKGVKAGRK